MSRVISRSVDEDIAKRYRAEGLWDTGSLRDGLERIAASSPDRIALLDADRRLTYAEVVERVARAIGHLRAAGVGPGSSVLIVAPVSASAVVAYLATIRLGALAVLLDRRCGRSDVDHATGPLDIGFVIAEPETATSLALSTLGKPLLAFDDLLAPIGEPVNWAEPDLDAPAAIFFTSGTTERPKAVIHCINTLRSGSREMAEASNLTGDDVVFLSSPLASITGIVQVHLALERGAGLALENHFNPSDSLRLVIDLGITVIGGATVILDILYKEAIAQGIDELPLRVTLLGGGAIPRDLVELGLERWGVQPVRVYGSSEAPVATHTMPEDVGERRLADDGGLGAGVEIRLDDTNAGEILLRGPMLFMEYVHAQDNDSAFVDDGWYRTGDLGRVEDGRLWITGRLKEIVARKGLKISVNEIDTMARGLPDVDEAACYGVPDPETGERLVLAVHAPSEQVTFEDVTSWLLDNGLAKWKLPEEIVVWDRPFPRTESGKIQRRLLDGGGVRHLVAPRLRAQQDR